MADSANDHALSRRRIVDPAVRFESKISAEPNSGCWLWTDCVVGDWGYGYFSIRGEFIPAHRFSYELYVGPIPEGLVLDHLCRVPSCVNPRHLEPVTQRVNALRGVGFTSQLSKLTRCLRGHAFDVANTRRRPDGSRACRKCNADRARREYREHHP